MSHTHISVLNAIHKLKELNSSINMIPHSKSAHNEEDNYCRNCQIFTKQLTKMSMENQILQQANEEVEKYQEEYKALE